MGSEDDRDREAPAAPVEGNKTPAPRAEAGAAPPAPAEGGADPPAPVKSDAPPSAPAALPRFRQIIVGLGVLAIIQIGVLVMGLRTSQPIPPGGLDLPSVSTSPAAAIASPSPTAAPTTRPSPSPSTSPHPPARSSR